MLDNVEQFQSPRVCGQRAKDLRRHVIVSETYFVGRRGHRRGTNGARGNYI